MLAGYRFCRGGLLLYIWHHLVHFLSTTRFVDMCVARGPGHWSMTRRLYKLPEQAQPVTDQAEMTIVTHIGAIPDSCHYYSFISARDNRPLLFALM